MTFLLDLTVKSAAALSVAFLAAWALCRGSASLRYALWSCALAGLLLLPLASLTVPRWNVPVTRGAAPAPAAPDAAAVSTSVVVQARRSSSPNWPVLLWIAGIAAMIARIGIGHWRVRSLYRDAEPVRDPLLPSSVTLKRSTATDVPLTYGLFRSTILLPGDAFSWTPERRRIVLAHELIHASRRDSLWALLAQSALALHWFNPLAWLAARQFRKEQERSCDDAVVTAGTASADYAGHLVEVARAIAVPEAALGMAEGFDLEGRIHALLDPHRDRRSAGLKLRAAIAASALAVTVSIAALHAAPQSASRATLSGTILDPSGAVIPRASISLKSTHGADEEAAVTNDAGAYSLSAIPAGEYLVKVLAPGFAIFQKTVTLQPGAAAALNFSLNIGEVKEAIEIAAERPQAAAPATAPRRIRVGGMVQPIKLISKVAPVYPPDARAEGVEATVVLRAIVSKTGGLLHVTSVSDVDPRLVSAAISAVSLWRYEPTLLNGEPVEVATTITVAFKLE